MTLPMFVANVLAFAVVVASVRLWRLAGSGHTTTLSIKIRWATVLLLQPVLALLLYLTLFPYERSGESAALVVLTAGVTPAQLDRHQQTAQQVGQIVALPEAENFPGVQRVPDLATAMRQYPGSTRLQVIGAGLRLRDREAAKTLPLDFDAAPLPRGVVELWSPAQVRAGARWSLHGRVEDTGGGVVELHDPGGQRVDRRVVDKDGRFVLRGSARGPGRAAFALRVFDARQTLVEELEVPVLIDAGTRLRVLVLAGGPDPELKYLRRWAMDAGVLMHTQISLGAGLQIGDGAIAFDAASLRTLDLVVLDERAWRGLGASRKTTLREAMRGGLGLLLRITGPLADTERRELRELGFRVDTANVAQSLSLPASLFTADGAETTTTSTAAESTDKTITLGRQPLRISSADGVALLSDDTDAPLALWRSEDQGRIGLWWLSDSYRLVLAGQSAVHGQLWSDAFGTLARARRVRQPSLVDHDPRSMQRLTLCGLGDAASVVAPGGGQTRLLIDAAAGRVGCAAYWPARAGWHVVQDGEQRGSFHVRGDGEAPGLRAHALREATQQLSVASVSAAQARPIRMPGAAWPWFFGWLVVMVVGWWLERRVLRGK